MNLEILNVIFVFAGGLGMFLYGMNVMASGLQKSAGNKMKRLLGYLTKNRFLAILVGALVTAILQSSSATTVLIVGFVNASIINLVQAVGIIMGANIGTTVTAWIVSMSEWSAVFKPDFIAPVVVAIGAFIIMFNGKDERKKELGEILIGFGLLFIGLSFMSDAIKPYRDAQIFKDAFSILGKNPLLGILVGAIVTAILQSSSASVGILQTLAMNMTLGWNSVVFITLGQNIGTCVTALISSVGANKTAKRAAVIHLLFNVIGTAIFGVAMYIIFKVNVAFANSHMSVIEISIFHTVFNVSNTLLLFPFAKGLVKLSGFFVDDSKIEVVTEDDIHVALRHLDERILETPSFAVQSAVKEVIHMGEITLENVNDSIYCLLENDKKLTKKVFKQEKVIDAHAKVISEYLVKINNLSLTERQHQLVNNLFYTISNIERVGDHAENLAELALEKIEHEIRFTDEAYKEIKEICETAMESFDYAIRARSTEEAQYIMKVVKLEEKVDDLRDQLRERHMKRLSDGVCTSENGVIFNDALINLERISDHSLNIANFVKDEINN